MELLEGTPPPVSSGCSYWKKMWQLLVDKRQLDRVGSGGYCEELVRGISDHLTNIWANLVLFKAGDGDGSSLYLGGDLNAGLEEAGEYGALTCQLHARCQQVSKDLITRRAPNACHC